MKREREAVRSNLLRGAAMGLCLPFVAASAVSAQEESDDGGGMMSFGDVAELEGVVITGSRVATESLASPVPVTTLSREELFLSGERDLVDFAMQAPALTNSITAATPLDFFTAFRNFEGGDTPLGPNGRTSFGIGALNLRSLGTGRTLVLVDGQRHVGARAGDTAVDVNSIAPSMVERVEILTGGASAIYGADAVSGVVNIITRQDFDGFQVQSDFQINEDGEGERYYAAVSYGRKFDDDKGQFHINIDYRNQAQLICGDAAFCADGAIEEQTNNPAGDPPRLFTQDVRFAPGRQGRLAVDFNGDGFPDVGAPTGVDFFLDVNNDGVQDLGQGQRPFFPGSLQTNPDGSLSIFDDGTVVSGFVSIGGEGEISGQDNVEGILPETEHLVINSAAEYAFDPRLIWFVDAKGSFTSAERRKTFSSFNTLLPVSVRNPFIPSELDRALDQAGDTLPGSTQILVSKSFFDLGIQDQYADRDTIRLVTGFKGDFDNGLSYEASFNYGRFSEAFTETDERVNDRFFAALDSVIDPATGQPACRSEVDLDGDGVIDATPPLGGDGFKTFTPGSGACVPLNVFGEGNASQAAIDFITVDAVNTTRTEQQVATAVLNGDSTVAGFELPAGPVGFAVGAEWRDEFSRFTPDLFSQNGLRFDDAATSNPQNSPLSGSFSVWELFGELRVPIIRDASFAREIALSGAARFADYTTVGGTLSWQVNATWVPVDDIAFRAGISESIRAPNIRELFLPAVSQSFNVADPCDAGNIDDGPNARRQNCLSNTALGVPQGFSDSRAGISIQGESAGNPNLEEEEAQTLTVGTVITPQSLPGLSVTVDYWSIDLDGLISLVSPQEEVDNCFDSADFPDNTFCDNISRARGGEFPDSISFIRSQQANIGGAETAGIDFDVSYEASLADLLGSKAGKIRFRTFGTWLKTQQITPNALEPSVIDDELGEFRRPEWVINGRLTWQQGDTRISYNARYMSRQLKGVENENIASFLNPYTDAFVVHDISGTYALRDGIILYGGVNNIADRDPAAQVTSFPTNPLGRRFFLGLQASF